MPDPIFDGIQFNFAEIRTITGQVVGIVDGDTFDVIDESKKKIRIGLHGADSPESSQAFIQRAKESLDDLI